MCANQKKAEAHEPHRGKEQSQEVLLHSTALLSGIIASAMDAIISVDAGQHIRLFNSAAERMFRCKAADVFGKTLDILIPARFRGTHRHHIHEFGTTGVTNRAMGHLQPLSALRADGEEFPIEASISQVELDGERIFTVILRDITARQQAEEDIRRLNAELERRVEARTHELTEANRELESFTYSVAHDLRAPLRHLDAFSRILLEEYSPQLPKEARQYLRTIARSSRMMSRLVEDLLNLARIGRHEMRLQPTPLDDIARHVANQLQREIKDRQIDWQIGPLPTVNVDPGLMKQVFINLLSNAVKYSRPREKARIEVGQISRPECDAIFVRDNGVGFDMQFASKLFGVFQRLHGTEEFEGTGVGLATVDRIIRRHGGRVWAEAEVDKGATFYFTLPELKKSDSQP